MSKGLKSAYELALERLESRGIERPDAGALSDQTKAEMAEVRSKAEAAIAELEIRHKERRAKLQTFAEREQEDQDYRTERRRIEDDREGRLEALRGRR